MCACVSLRHSKPKNKSAVSTVYSVIIMCCILLTRWNLQIFCMQRVCPFCWETISSSPRQKSLVRKGVGLWKRLPEKPCYAQFIKILKGLDPCQCDPPEVFAVVSYYLASECKRRRGKFNGPSNPPYSVSKRGRGENVKKQKRTSPFPANIPFFSGKKKL